jgi:predicted RNA-binding Zn-ribbon protein involved in translation (DUF1610 family)
MKNGRCPMCGAEDVYASTKDCFRAGSDVVKYWVGITFVPYLCASCGYTAMYVHYLDKLPQQLADAGFEKVPVS